MPRPTRAKPPVPAWIIRERKRLGPKPRDLAERLTAMGLAVTEGTVRTWEAGRSPHPDNIEGLERKPPGGGRQGAAGLLARPAEAMKRREPEYLTRDEVILILVLIVLVALGCLASQGLLIRQIIAGNGWS